MLWVFISLLSHYRHFKILVFVSLYEVKWSEVARCVWLFDPMDCSPPGSSVHGIFQATVLEWVAISFSRGSSWLRDQTWVSHIVGRRFTIWAIREAPYLYIFFIKNKNCCIKLQKHLGRGKIYNQPPMVAKIETFLSITFIFVNLEVELVKNKEWQSYHQYWDLNTVIKQYTPLPFSMESIFFQIHINP